MKNLKGILSNILCSAGNALKDDPKAQARKEKRAKVASLDNNVTRGINAFQTMVKNAHDKKTADSYRAVAKEFMDGKIDNTEAEDFFACEFHKSL